MPQMKPIDGDMSLCETTSKPQDITGAVPECDLWLSKHPEARKSVLAALEKLKAGQFSQDPPVIDVDEPWMEELED